MVSGPLSARAVASAPPRLRVSDAELTAFRGLLDEVRLRDGLLAAALEQGAVLSASAASVEVAYEPADFSVPTVTSDAARALLAPMVREHFGVEAELRITTSGEHEGAASVAQVDAYERRQRLEAARREVAEHPLVTAAIEIFGAELRDVRLPPSQGY